MNVLFKHLSKPNQFYFWVLLAVIVRAVISMLYSKLLLENQGTDAFIFDFVFIHPDYGYFLHPVDLYFEKGIMTYDGHTAFAGRMPGYSFPYFLLRLVFERPFALLSLILMQIGLSGLAVYALAKLALDWFKSSLSFYFVFFIALFSPLLSVYDFQSITESFSISCFILHVFFLHKAVKDKRDSYFLLSGFFIAWAVFLRPFLGLALLLSGLLILFEWRKSRILLKQLLMFAAAFILFESAWIVRNYNATGKFIPLESGLAAYGKIYSAGYQKVRELMYRMGEETAYVDPGMAKWMRREKEQFQSNKRYDESTVPKLSELHKIREFYQASRSLEGEAFEKADQELIALAESQLLELKSTKPFAYYVSGPLHGLRKLWLHSGSAYLPFPPFNEMNLLEKGIKLSSAALYYLILIMGIFGLFRLKIGWSFKAYFVLFPIALSVALVLVSTIQEARYVVTVFPLMLLMSGGLLSNYGKLQQRGSEN